MTTARPLVRNLIALVLLVLGAVRGAHAIEDELSSSSVPDGTNGNPAAPSSTAVSTITGIDAGNAPVAIDLDTAVRAALRNSRELRYIAINGKIEEEKLRLGIRVFFPELELGGGSNDSVTYASPDSRSKQFSVGFNQLLFDAGRTMAQYKNRKLSLDLERFNIGLAREEIIFSVIGLYTDLIKFREQKRIQHDVHELTLIQQKIAQEERRLGMITEVDFLDIALSAKNIEIELEATEHEEKLLSFRFAKLMGIRATDTRFQALGSIDFTYGGFIEDLDPAAWMKRIEARNLSLRQKRFELSMQKEAVGQAQAWFLPELRGNFRLVFSGDDLPLSELGFSFGLTASFRIPTFPVSAGANIGKQGSATRSSSVSVSGQPASGLEELYSVRAAELAYEKAGADFSDAMYDLRFSVESLVFEIEKAKRLLALYREKYTLETKKTEILKLKLDLGGAKRIDYLDSAVELAKLKIEIVSRAVELYGKEMSLLRMGGTQDAYETQKYIIKPE